MEGLAVGRNSLRRTRVCSWSCAHRPLFLTSSSRRYALTSTARRMAAIPPSVAHDNRHLLQEMSDSSQAYPLSGYYSVILNSDSPYHDRPAPVQSTTFQAESGSESMPTPTAESVPTPQERMAIVFGTRLAGPGRQSRYNPGEAPPMSTWKTINGVPIPPRPEEPENCCMSGCVNCVWDGFRDEMEEWAATIANAKAKGGPKKQPTDMRTAPKAAQINSASLSMDDDGGGSETNWAAPSQGDDLFADIPVGIREFMKTEKKLRVKHQQEAMV